MTACAESGEREDLPATASDDDDAPHVACSALGKLRLPRSLLEKWVEEPFFEKAVVGCFVRLGVGKAPGARGEPQYKVCEIISVDEYKHAYPFGEFETRKALMLRIGRNQRLWRMSVISNHRFTDAELQEWQSIMRTERQKIPSVIEINRRKAQMRKAVFGVRSGPQRTDLDRDEVQEMASLSNDVHWVVASESTAAYSEMDVAKIVDARRKRNEAARFRDRHVGTVARLNHGQTRTRYEHEVYSARDAYASLLVSHGNKLEITPELEAAIQKVECAETWQRADNDGFERDLDVLASMLLESRRNQLPGTANGETEDCRIARKLYRETRQRLVDFQKNAQDMRKKLDIDAPSRTSTLHAINEAKKHENALADMAYGEKKIRDEHDRDADVDHSIFQRRATKPTMLWTTKKKHSISSSTITDQPETEASAIENTTYKQLTVSESVSNPSTQIEISTEDEGSQRLSDQSRMQRQRNGMSLHEYLSKARATTK